MIGIYVHIPFCESKCIYCAFASFVRDENFQDRYFEFLNKEIKNCNFPDREVASIYFGGGTPSCVSEKQIVKTLQTIKSAFHVLPDAEITIECNPCSASLEKLKAYHSAGFNRVSFGVQSLNDKMLKFLGRRHTKAQALAAIENAKRAGFDNISADLLLGLPKDDVQNDAKILLRSGVKHISAYMLQIEDGTPLKNMVESGKVKLPDDDVVVKKYQKLADFLQKNGFLQYEISNFALKGFKSKHNYAYWTGQAYLGFGLGAHSFDGGFVRWANADNFEDYFLGKQNREVLSSSQRDEEVIMLGLRCDAGFRLDALNASISEKPIFKKYVQDNILKVQDGIIRLNSKYYNVSNSIILHLID